MINEVAAFMAITIVCAAMVGWVISSFKPGE